MRGFKGIHYKDSVGICNNGFPTRNLRVPLNYVHCAVILNEIHGLKEYIYSVTISVQYNLS